MLPALRESVGKSDEINKLLVERLFKEQELTN
ncbi:hypothetical protein JOC69_000041 [Heliobacterium gestii]|nr:hypothetical protein [Heliomicrobium gestii]